MPAVTNHRLASLDPAPVPAPIPPQTPVAAAAPRSRPSWSGLLRLSLVSFPIKAYAAVPTNSPSAFHLLHAHCGQRIRYAKQCPLHGPVDSDALVRGYEYTTDQYLVVEPEELERLRPPRDKALVLEQFVPLQEIPPTFYAGRSLYLVPDGPAAQHPYGVLVEAFGRSGRAALGRVVLSTQRQLVLVRAAGRLLVLDVLHYPAQVRSLASWEAELAPYLASEAEQDLAAQLITLASAPLDWARYRDTSAEELAALIDAKRAQQPPAALPEEPVVLKLLDALKQSVAAACEATTAAPPKARKPRSRRVMG